jgi:hypothetical protein
MVMVDVTGKVGAQCEGCHAAPTEGGALRTWPTREAALAWLTEPARAWALDQGRLLCPHCARRTACARQGHSYGEWTATPGEPLAFRVCRACRAQEHAPAYVIAPRASQAS